MNPIWILLLLGCCGCGNECGNWNGCCCDLRTRADDCGCKQNNRRGDCDCDAHSRTEECGCEHQERSNCRADDSDNYGAMPPHWRKYTEERERSCGCEACEA